MNLNEIQELIKFVSKSGVTEVEIEKKDFKIIIKSDAKKGASLPAGVPQAIQVAVPALPTAPVAIPAAPAPVAAPAAALAPAPAPAASNDANLVTIKSPMIGTFYRASSPDKPSFVNIGDEIKPGKVLCIIEAMKLFNEIESEVSGRIVKVLVDDASPVEYDQPLFLVEPA
jgi:acetyl-CoA carboxylase biotin carboxyl carrier protein